MSRIIKVTISKEDTYDVQKLIDEIKENPVAAYELCEEHGYEGLELGAFTDFDSSDEKDQDRVLKDLAVSKSIMDAELTENQKNMFDRFH